MLEIHKDDLGRIAYDAYSAFVGGVSVRGDILWSWDEMHNHNPRVCDAWIHAATCVASAVSE